ncbi:MAG: hypothetical protein KGJ59_15210, partial [Bacteroidota bacterium]|nr:hypothetical protein [Bacteroidota bacterium]
KREFTFLTTSRLQKYRHIFIAVVLMLVTVSPNLFACGSCYGDPHSSQTQGMNAAIMSMLGITATLFLAMSTFVFLLRRKVAMMRAKSVDSEGAK